MYDLDPRVHLLLTNFMGQEIQSLPSEACTIVMY